MPEFDAGTLAKWCGGTWDRPPSGPILGAAADTRRLEPGWLFFALPGESRDGHAYIPDAFRRGAAGAVARRGVEVPGGGALPILRVEDPGRALCAAAARYRAAGQVRIVGVTGSAGKSTVKELCAQMMEVRYRTARTPGNWNNAIGLPLSLLAMEPDAEIGVFEVGSNHPGEIADLCRVLRPDSAIVTNIGPVHIEYFGSVEGVAREKSALIEALPAGGPLVLDRDGAFFDRLRRVAPGPVLAVSLEGAADYEGRGWDAMTRRMTVAERASGDTFSLQLPLPGRHNAANALLAIAAARVYGVDWDAILRALETYRPMPMRWEERELAGLVIVNDAYNANPVSMRAAIRTFRERFPDRPRWLALGGMSEMGECERDEHRLLGEWLASEPWRGLVGVGEPGAWIADAAVRAGMPADRAFRCQDTGEAARVLADQAAPGSAVLLKASRGFRFESLVEALTGRGKKTCSTGCTI